MLLEKVSKHYWNSLHLFHKMSSNTPMQQHSKKETLSVMWLYNWCSIIPVQWSFCLDKSIRQFAFKTRPSMKRKTRPRPSAQTSTYDTLYVCHTHIQCIHVPSVKMSILKWKNCRSAQHLQDDIWLPITKKPMDIAIQRGAFTDSLLNQ